MTTYITAQPPDTTLHAEAIAMAVRRLEYERDYFRGVLADLADGYTQTSRDDMVLLQVPPDVWITVQEALNMPVPAAPCADCGTDTYVGTDCGACAWSRLEEGSAT